MLSSIHGFIPSANPAKSADAIRKDNAVIASILELAEPSTLDLTMATDREGKPSSNIELEMEKTRQLENELAASTNSKEIKEYYKMVLNEHHLALLKRILEPLKEDCNAKSDPIQPPAPKTATWKRNLYRLFASAMAFIPISEGLAGGMLLMEDLAEVFTFIPKIAITIASIAFSVLWTYMFYKLEGHSLKTTLGVDTSENVDRTIAILDEELATVERINKLTIENTKNLDDNHPGKLDEYAGIMLRLNGYIQVKSISNPTEFVEPGLRRLGRLTFTGISMALAATTAYFIIQSALTTLAALTPVIITAPWSLLILIPAMLAFAGYYYTLQARGAFKSLNPQAEKYEETTKRLLKFRESMCHNGNTLRQNLDSPLNPASKKLIIKPEAVATLTKSEEVVPVVASNTPIAVVDTHTTLAVDVSTNGNTISSSPPQASAVSPGTKGGNNEQSSTAMLLTTMTAQNTPAPAAILDGSNSVSEEWIIIDEATFTRSRSSNSIMQISIIDDHYSEGNSANAGSACKEQTCSTSNADNNPAINTRNAMFQPSSPKAMQDYSIKAAQEDIANAPHSR